MTAPSIEPRRTVGAVVRILGGGYEYIVVEPGKGSCVQRVLGDPDRRVSSVDSDRFVRWATRAECERHGIEYVERGEPTPVAAPTTAYVPRVGDVVYNCDDEPGKADRVIVGTDGDQFTARFLAPRSGEMTGYGGGLYWRYLRPASPAERAAAGLPVAPAAVRDDERDEIAQTVAGNIRRVAGILRDLANAVESIAARAERREGGAR